MAGAPPTGLVLSSREGPTRVLGLYHPPLNVLSGEVLDALAARLDEVEQDPEVRVLVLLSEVERAFAVGADIREMAPLDRAGARRHGVRGQAVTRRIERLPLPVIAAVHGPCFGGGCEIALACDFIVASDDAAFGQPEINLGIMPGWGGTRRLPRRIGPTRARQWILTGRTFSAREAWAQGLLERVVSRPELRLSALELAAELAAKPPIALAAAKYALLQAIDPGVDEGLRYERELWARLFGTRDQREGMAAFLQKRPLEHWGREDWAAASRGFPWSHPRSSQTGRKRNKPKGSGRR